jgi:hypothetical protein
MTDYMKGPGHYARALSRFDAVFSRSAADFDNDETYVPRLMLSSTITLS